MELLQLPAAQPDIHGWQKRKKAIWTFWSPQPFDLLWPAQTRMINYWLDCYYDLDLSPFCTTLNYLYQCLLMVIINEDALPDPSYSPGPNGSLMTSLSRMHLFFFFSYWFSSISYSGKSLQFGNWQVDTSTSTFSKVILLFDVLMVHYFRSYYALKYEAKFYL